MLLSVYRNFFQLLISSLAVLLCIASLACGKSRQTDGVKITWWHFWGEPYQKPLIRKMISDFEKMNPDVSIEATELTWSSGYEKLVAAFSGNRAPDVLELGSDWVREFATNRVLLDLTPWVDSIRASYLGWEMAEVDSGVYAFPWLLGSRALFVNKSLVDPAKISDLNSLKRAVCSAHQPSKKVYGFGNTKLEPHQLYKKVLPFIWTFGGDILTSDGSTSIVSSKQNQAALQFYLDMCECGLLESQKNLDDAFVEGHVAVVFSGGWLIRKISERNPTLDYAILLFPSNETGQPGVSFFGGEYLAVSANCNQRTAALAWIRFLADPANNLPLCSEAKVVVPSARSAMQSDYFKTRPLERRLYEQLVNSRPSPRHPQWNRIEEILENEIESAVYKTKSARQALDDADRRINKVIER